MNDGEQYGGGGGGGGFSQNGASGVVVSFRLSTPLILRTGMTAGRQRAAVLGGRQERVVVMVVVVVCVCVCLCLGPAGGGGGGGGGNT